MHTRYARTSMRTKPRSGSYMTFATDFCYANFLPDILTYSTLGNHQYEYWPSTYVQSVDRRTYVPLYNMFRR